MLRTRSTIFVLALTLLTSACSSDPPAEGSFKKDLELRLGQKLTPTQIVEYKDAAELLCSMNEEVLKQVWLDLDQNDFAFQTFVFTQQCPEREALYRESRLERDDNTTTDATTSSTTTTSPSDTATTPSTTTTTR